MYDGVMLSGEEVRTTKQAFIEELEEGMVLEEDVFSSDDSLIPLIKKNVVLTRKVIEILKNHGVQKVYIEGTDTLSRLFVPRPQPLVDDPMRHKALTSLEDLFEIVRQGDEGMTAAPQLVKELDAVVEELVDSLIKDQGTLVNITDLKSYDEYTYHHSLSVSVVSIAIGQGLGLSRDQLAELGKCALMHDIGKIAVPIQIINKPDRLSDQEFHQVQEHSPEGYRYLLRHSIGNERIWMGVLSHHEKFDGTGYPNHLLGNEIPLYSRIISVADVYDALTSNRPYREPMQPAEAVEYIMGNVETMFDYDIVTAFLKKIELYPIGSFIELSNGSIAVVLQNENPMRPVVRVVDSGEVLDLYWDLACLSLTVRRILPLEKVRARLQV